MQPPYVLSCSCVCVLTAPRTRCVRGVSVRPRVVCGVVLHSCRRGSGETPRGGYLALPGDMLCICLVSIAYKPKPQPKILLVILVIANEVALATSCRPLRGPVIVSLGGRQDRLEDTTRARPSEGQSTGSSTPWLQGRQYFAISPRRGGTVLYITRQNLSNAFVIATVPHLIHFGWIGQIPGENKRNKLEPKSRSHL